MLDNGRMLPPGEMASFWYLGDRFCPALYSNHELASRRFWVDISYYFCFFASKVKKNKTLLMIRFSFFREAPPCPTQVVFLCNGRSCYNYLTFSSSFFQGWPFLWLVFRIINEEDPPLPPCLLISFEIMIYYCFYLGDVDEEHDIFNISFLYNLHRLSRSFHSIDVAGRQR